MKVEAKKVRRWHSWVVSWSYSAPDKWAVMAVLFAFISWGNLLSVLEYEQTKSGARKPCLNGQGPYGDGRHPEPICVIGKYFMASWWASLNLPTITMPMEMNLQPLATTCHVSGDIFAQGDRVVSHLVRGETMEIQRYDVAERCLGAFAPEGVTVCRWMQAYKPKEAGESPDRELKMTADNLFATLADPVNALDADGTRLLQFLALMLERKRVLRPKGLSSDGATQIFEHAKTKERHQVPVGELDPAFFVAVQQQLNVLVGSSAESQDLEVAEKAGTPI